MATEPGTAPEPVQDQRTGRVGSGIFRHREMRGRPAWEPSREPFPGDTGSHTNQCCTRAGGWQPCSP